MKKLFILLTVLNLLVGGSALYCGMDHYLHPVYPQILRPVHLNINVDVTYYPREQQHIDRWTEDPETTEWSL